MRPFHFPLYLRGFSGFSLAGLLALALPLAGCFDDPPPDRGANQSLVEIGERALERGEDLERDGRRAESNAEYRRALWAFRYHERLTGEEPFLLDEAVDGMQRTGGKR